MKSSRLHLLAALIIGLCSVSQLAAQATLSVQGTLQNFNGTAVDNGQYDITFKLYTTDAGGTPIWSEVQTVNMIGGVYSVLLGATTPLNVPFDQTYYLGLTIPGGPEHTPRTRLTAAPYALSLLGQDNKFPSTGNVGIRTTAPTTTLDANGSISTATVTTSAAAYTVLAADHVIFLDLAGAQAVTLPSAVTFPRREIVLINKTSTAKTVSSYVNLAGAAATAIPANGMIELRSNGTEWRLATTFAPPGASAKAYVYAIGAPTTVPSGGNHVPLTPYTEHLDFGNDFNSTTGVFTAPRTGIYNIAGLYTGVLNSSTGSNSSASVAAICSTGACAPYGNANVGALQVGSGTSGYIYISLSWIVYMVAGQTFDLRIYQTTGQSLVQNGCLFSISEQ